MTLADGLVTNGAEFGLTQAEITKFVAIVHLAVAMITPEGG